jgi:hypothetical protein
MAVVNAYLAVGSKEKQMLDMNVVMKLIKVSETLKYDIRMMAKEFGITRLLNVV